MAKATMPSARDKAIDAFLALLAEQRFSSITLHDVASRAGLTLADLRGTARSTFGYWVGFMQRLDAIVLKELDPALETEPTKERLFDVLMRRIDAMVPHKAAIRSMVEAAKRDPSVLVKLNEVSVQSTAWMLEAAGIACNGASGRLKAQAVAVMYARVIDTFLDDEDADLAATMRALDKGLTRAGRAARLYDDLCGLVRPFEAVARGLFCLTPFARRRRAWPHDRWQDRDETYSEPKGKSREGEFQSDDLRPVNGGLA